MKTYFKTFGISFVLPFFLAGFVGCSDDGSGGADLSVGPDLARPIGADGQYPLYQEVLFDNSHRINDATATLPSGLFSQVTLHIELACPESHCDPWDRIGTVAVVQPSGDDAGSEQLLEVGRFITPYGVKGTWDLDVTELQPLLSGEVKFRARIDTYVEKGQMPYYGNGWSLSLRLDYVGGVPSPEPLAVQPLAWHDFVIGDPNRPVASSLPTQAVVLPEGATGAWARVIVTGHGQGNKDNCGEFCVQEHALLVDGQEAARAEIWRDNCADNPINNQKGTWKYDRAGWCPGDKVDPWKIDLGARPQSFTLNYTTDDYVNTCSPDNCQADTCSLGTGCEYDGGNHTEPFYSFSALLISYRQ